MTWARHAGGRKSLLVQKELLKAQVTGDCWCGGVNESRTLQW
jgi:hypothetical protein